MRTTGVERLARSAAAAALTLTLAGQVGAAPAAAAATATAAVDEPSAVPYRPSVSTPATLSAPGWLEVEAGFQHEHDGATSRRQSLPVTLKLAFTPDWGIRVGSDGWVRSRGETGRRESGYGDTSVVLKRRFAIDDGAAFGLEAGATAPTARHGLGSGSGKADYTINAIHSADLGDWHTDINVATTRLGHAEPEAARVQVLGAAALSRSLNERWGIVGEVSGTHQRGSDSTRQLLLAASYNVSKRLVLDAGAARSLRSGAPSWSAFTGFTWLAGRVF